MFIIVKIGCAECIGWGHPDDDEPLASMANVGFPSEEAALDSLDLPQDYRDKFLRTKDGHLLYSEPEGGYLIAKVPTQLSA